MNSLVRLFEIDTYFNGSAFGQAIEQANPHVLRPPDDPSKSCGETRQETFDEALMQQDVPSSIVSQEADRNVQGDDGANKQLDEGKHSCNTGSSTADLEEQPKGTDRPGT